MRAGVRGFTLIELLIVVAIIAILALIAVPNFLEAQTRSKVARVKTELRTIAVALEAYCVTENDYPRNSESRRWTIPVDLTTPVSYLGTANLIDLFALYKENDPLVGFPYYSYHRVLTADEVYPPGPSLRTEFWPPEESTDGPAGMGNPNALLKYGMWRMMSLGPDRLYLPPDWSSMSRPEIYRLIEMNYDPTNGTVSWGNISRTQLSPEGIVQYRP